MTAGTVLNRFIYSAYGEAEVFDAAWSSVSTPSVPWTQLFQGLSMTALTGLAYVRHRDYSPRLGRFIQRDPLGFEAGDTNWYRFVGNEPNGNVDPSGLISNLPWWLPPQVIDQIAEELTGYDDAVKKAMQGAMKKSVDLAIRSEIEKHRTGGLNPKCGPTTGEFFHPNGRTAASGLGFNTNEPENALQRLNANPNFIIDKPVVRARIKYWKGNCGVVDYNITILADITIRPRPPRRGNPVTRTDIWFGRIGSYDTNR